MVAGLLDDVAEPPRYSLLDSVSGLCDNVTSGAVVDVFYTRAGLAQRTPLYTIVGASITYVRARSMHRHIGRYRRSKRRNQCQCCDHLSASVCPIAYLKNCRHKFLCLLPIGRVSCLDLFLSSLRCVTYTGCG